MNLDLDVSRDESSAFGAASVTDGALLPYEGRTFLLAAERPPVDALAVEEDGWLAPCAPVLVRGQARILPLAWQRQDHGPGFSSEEIAALASKTQSAGMHWAGNWRVLEELKAYRGDSIRSYVGALTASGATRVNAWTYGDSVGFALVWTGDASSLALHVVPSSWVSERHAKKAVRVIDVRWSWAEVVALHGARETPQQ